MLQDLVRHYNVRRVTFDRWNSAHSIQELVKMGVEAEDMSFSNAEQLAMYRFARLLFYNNMIELPLDEALQNELKFLKEKGGKIEHDLYGKDRADAVVAAAWNASGRKYSNVRQGRPVSGVAALGRASRLRFWKGFAAGGGPEPGEIWREVRAGSVPSISRRGPLDVAVLELSEPTDFASGQLDLAGVHTRRLAPRIPPR